MANTFRKIYKKTGSSGTSSDYQLVGNVGVNGVELDIMKGATSSSSGEIGLVPKPTSGYEDRVLTGDATWKTIDTLLRNSSLFGSTSISDIDDGTVTGAIDYFKSNTNGMVQFSTRDIIIDTAISGASYTAYAPSEILDLSKLFPNAKFIIAAGGRRSGTNHVCTSVVDGGRYLYCLAPSQGVYTVTVVGFYGDFCLTKDEQE